MPSIEALDSMSQLIANVRWADLKFPDHRAQVMALALSDEHNAILDAIEGHLGSLVAETEKIEKQLDLVTDFLQPVCIWFEKSKLWEGEAYVRTS